MSAEIYERLQDTAARLIERFSQGVAIYTAPPVTSGTSFNPTITPGTKHELKYTRVAGNALYKYISGGFVQVNDLVITVTNTQVQIELAGSFEIAGKKYKIIMADPVILDPDTPILWRVGLRR